MAALAGHNRCPGLYCRRSLDGQPYIQGQYSHAGEIAATEEPHQVGIKGIASLSRHSCIFRTDYTVRKIISCVYLVNTL